MGVRLAGKVQYLCSTDIVLKCSAHVSIAKTVQCRRGRLASRLR